MSRTQRRALPVTVLGLALLAACWPEPHAQDAGVASGDGGGAAVAPARFSNLQQSIFERHCVTDCHEAINAGAGLTLTRERAHGALVNQRSQQITTRYRVLPGDAPASYLLKKLEASDDYVGDRMPKGAPRRPPAELEQIRLWIGRGAPND